MESVKFLLSSLKMSMKSTFSLFVFDFNMQKFFPKRGNKMMEESSSTKLERFEKNKLFIKKFDRIELRLEKLEALLKKHSLQMSKVLSQEKKILKKETDIDKELKKVELHEKKLEKEAKRLKDEEQSIQDMLAENAIFRGTSIYRK